jgi:ATP phosphoribosyltransferase regulatory subunit HisZ
MLLAIEDLEEALATASFDREGFWAQRLIDSLGSLQTALRETRESAQSEGSMLGQLVREFPRLQGRADRLRKDYDALQKQVEKICLDLLVDSPASPQDVEQTREQLAKLLAKLRYVQAIETELLFEAYQVDIGVGD